MMFCLPFGGRCFAGLAILNLFVTMPNFNQNSEQPMVIMDVYFNSDY